MSIPALVGDFLIRKLPSYSLWVAVPVGVSGHPDPVTDDEVFS